MQSRQTGASQSLSAAKAGISERSGRRLEKTDRAAPASHTYRTRPDPLEAVWESELVPAIFYPLLLVSFYLNHWSEFWGSL